MTSTKPLKKLSVILQIQRIFHLMTQYIASLRTKTQNPPTSRVRRKLPLRSDNFINKSLVEDHFSLKNKIGFFYACSTESRRKIKEFIKSDGGCLLVCGHMGVGKTSLVNGVISELEFERTLKILDIHLDLAQEIDIDKIKVKIIERFHDKFTRNKNVFNKIEESYIKTLYSNIKEKKTENTAGNFEIGIDGGKGWIPKATTKFGKESVQELERALKEYDNIGMEHDIKEIINGLSAHFNKKPLSVRLWDWLSVKSLDFYEFIFGSRKKFKVVIVLDELDKQDKQEGRVEELVKSLKNIFTTLDMSFILISGHKTFDNFVKKQHSDIEYVFDNIITNTVYVPCLWNETKEMASCAIDEKRIAQDDRDWYDADYLSYMAYTSRGNLRRFVKELSNYKSEKFLEFDDASAVRIEKLSKIQHYVRKKFFNDALQLSANNMEIDNYLLESYRIIDYIINLKPDTALDVDIAKNEFTHESLWINGRETITQSARFGVDVVKVLNVLEELGYLSSKQED